MKNSNKLMGFLTACATFVSFGKSKADFHNHDTKPAEKAGKTREYQPPADFKRKQKTARKAQRLARRTERKNRK